MHVTLSSSKNSFFSVLDLISHYFIVLFVVLKATACSLSDLHPFSLFSQVYVLLSSSTLNICGCAIKEVKAAIFHAADGMISCSLFTQFL